MFGSGPIWRSALDGVFNGIFAALAAKGGKPDRLMIDGTHLKAHRTAVSLLKKGLYPYRAHQGRAELGTAGVRSTTSTPPATAKDGRSSWH